MVYRTAASPPQNTIVVSEQRTQTRINQANVPIAGVSSVSIVPATFAQVVLPVQTSASISQRKLVQENAIQQVLSKQYQVKPLLAPKPSLPPKPLLTPKPLLPPKPQSKLSQAQPNFLDALSKLSSQTDVSKLKSQSEVEEKLQFVSTENETSSSNSDLHSIQSIQSTSSMSKIFRQSSIYRFVQRVFSSKRSKSARLQNEASSILHVTHTFPPNSINANSGLPEVVSIQQPKIKFRSSQASAPPPIARLLRTNSSPSKSNEFQFSNDARTAARAQAKARVKVDVEIDAVTNLGARAKVEGGINANTEPRTNYGSDAELTSQALNLDSCLSEYLVKYYKTESDMNRFAHVLTERAQRVSVPFAMDLQLEERAALKRDIALLSNDIHKFKNHLKMVINSKVANAEATLQMKHMIERLEVLHQKVTVRIFLRDIDSVE